MGLDMYLSRKIYIGANYEHNEIGGEINLTKSGDRVPLNIKKVEYIEEEAAYWRKANAIHKWFVENVQDGNDDCGNYDVSINKLKELLILCKEVKSKAILKKGYVKAGERYQDGKWMPIVEEGILIENAEEIAEILPTESGFFFGSTEYDEYYMKDIEYTIKIIEEQIKEAEELKSKNIYSYLQYHSSW